MSKRFIVALMLASLLWTACDMQNVDVGSNAGPSPEEEEGSVANGGDKNATSESRCPTNTGPTISERVRTALPPGHSSTEIIVDADRSLGRISKLIYGANHRYPYNGFNMWDHRAGEPYPLFARRFKYAGFSAVRFPGGRTANNYHWQRAIGPVEQRLGHVDSAFGRQTIHSKALSSEFGPDEFGRFLETTGAEGSVVVNFATGTALEAANWVEYMNGSVGSNPNGGVAWAQERAENGHPQPYGVKYWEVGNELAGDLTFWLGPEATDEERASRYVFGGQTMFEQQPVVKFTDYSRAGARSTGKPHQSFFVRFPPAVPSSATVYVAGQAWRRVPDLDSAEHERVYAIDGSTGRITFGDGEHGKIPPKGARITITYVSGPHDGFNDFYRRMKAADSSIRIGSGLNSPLFISTMGETHPYDLVIAHSYSYFSSTPPNTDALHDLMMGLPEEQAAKVEITESAIADFAGEERAAKINIAITEWAMATGTNIGLGRIDAPLHYTQSLDGALYTALMLRQWIKLNIPLAQKHTLIDIDPDSPPPGYIKPRTAFQALIGPAPCYLLSAPALAFRMYSRFMERREVLSTVAGNPSRQTFLGEALPALATVATTNEAGDLSLMVVNRDRATDVKATVRTEGFAESRTATAWTLNGPDYLSYNSVRDPNKVAIGKTVLKGIQEGFRYMFPAHSITVIGFRANT